MIGFDTHLRPFSLLNYKSKPYNVYDLLLFLQASSKCEQILMD